jgi:hypothetical protein
MSALPALTLEEVTRDAINPALRLLPCKMDSPEARVMLLAIGLQESDFRDRRQLIAVERVGRKVIVPEGPAKSFWQGEQGGGMVHGVRNHPATRDLAAFLYRERGVPDIERAIWDAIENDDVLAAGLARLLIYSDPRRLPRIGDVDDAWALYYRTWRPGKPNPKKWHRVYPLAAEFVTRNAL